MRRKESKRERERGGRGGSWREGGRKNHLGVFWCNIATISMKFAPTVGR